MKILNLFLGNQCQSCGMPLKKDENGGGSEKDGSVSKLYCSHCYENGDFVDKNITAIEMKQYVADKMTSIKMPSFLINYFTKDITSLKRWVK